MWQPRRWPWWGWAALGFGCLLVLLVSVALLIRASGRAELRREIAATQAEGRGVFLTDLVALAPQRLDPTRQAAAWPVVSEGALNRESKTVTYGMSSRLRETNSARAEAMREVLDSTTTIRRQWHELHLSGPVCLSLMGWIGQDLPHPESCGLEEVEHARMPSHQSVRRLALALATEARMATDPPTALRDLDALVAALRPCGTIMDAMLFQVTAKVRDEAWLEAVSRGCDPAPFIGQAIDQLPVLAEGWRGERLLFTGALIQDCLANRIAKPSSPLPSGPTGFAEQVSLVVEGQLTGVLTPQDLATCLNIHRTAEHLLATGTGALKPLLTALQASRRPRFYSLSLINLSVCIDTAASSAILARAHRVAALVVAQQIRTGNLPEQLPDGIATSLLAASSFGPALTYQRLDAHRFRIVPDPATTPPDLLPATSIELPPTTPSRHAWRHGKCWLELDTSALDTP
jgi:hypothetical protein